MADNRLIKFALLLALICQTFVSFATSDSGNVEEEWRENYLEIFGEKKTKLDDRNILMIMMSMHDSLPQLSGTIPNDMQENFKSWYRFLVNVDRANCNIDYLERYHKQAKHNLVRLLDLGHINLLEVCRDLTFDIKEEVRSKLAASDETTIGKMLRSYEAFREGKRSEKELAKEVIYALQAEFKTSKSILSKAWKRGPCRKLKAAVENKDMISFESFLRLTEYNDIYKLRSYDLDGPNYWSRALKACDKLDEMMPNLAKYNTFGKVLLRNINIFGSATGDLNY